MKTGSLLHCALFRNREFAFLVRDQKPRRNELLEWLGFENAWVFWTLYQQRLPLLVSA